MKSRRYADNFIQLLAERGENSFTFEDYVNEQGVSEIAATSALRRLKEEGKIISPFAKFYVLLDPKYSQIGSPPASHFIDSLMNYLQRPYYVGLLSAGEYHGAAHQRPQVFQVIVENPMLEIQCGRLRIEFVANSNLKYIPLEKRNTPFGYVNVSTVEATVFDLVEYAKRSGGLNNVATVLSELVDKLSEDKLISLSRLYTNPILQRLGYLLEQVGALSLSLAIAKEVERLMPRYIPLFPGIAMTGAPRERRFRLALNENLEPDL